MSAFRSRTRRGIAAHYSRFNLIWIVLAALPILHVPCVYAHSTFEWALDGDIGWEQNPGYFPSGRLHGLNQLPSFITYEGGSVFYNISTPTLRARLAGTAGYIDYLNGNYPGRIIGSIDGQALYTLRPHYLYWMINETFGQATTNVLAGATTLNSTNVNMFSTGPQLLLPINYKWHIQLDATAGSVTYQTPIYPNDKRITANADLIDDMSAVSNAALEANYDNIQYSSYAFNYQGTELSSYSLESLYGHYAAYDQRDYASIDIGDGLIQQAGIVSQSPMLHLTFKRELSPHISAALSLAHDQTDSAAQFAHILITERLPTSLNNIDYHPIQENLANGPMQIESAVVSATWQGVRTRLELALNVSRDDYIDNAKWNSQSYGVQGYFLHRLTRLVDVKAQASEEHESYASIFSHYDLSIASVILGWHATQDTQITFGYRFERQSSNMGLYSYTDNSLFIGFRYSPFTYIGFANQMPTSFSGVGGPGADAQLLGPNAYY